MASQELSGQAPDKKRNRNLLIARLRAGLTQEQLATRAGVSRQAINALERDGGRPQAPNGKAIADALGADVIDLFPLEDEEVAA